MTTNNTRTVCVGAPFAAEARILTVIQEIFVHKRDLWGNLQVGDRVQFLVSSHPRRSEQGDQNRIRASRVKKAVLLREHDAAEAPAGEAGALSRLCG